MWIHPKNQCKGCPRKKLLEGGGEKFQVGGNIENGIFCRRSSSSILIGWKKIPPLSIGFFSRTALMAKPLDVRILINCHFACELNSEGRSCINAQAFSLMHVLSYIKYLWALTKYLLPLLISQMFSCKSIIMAPENLRCMSQRLEWLKKGIVRIFRERIWDSLKRQYAGC